MLELKQATKIYSSRVGTKVKALDNVNLKFNSTGLVFIHGRSGSGKTTLLSILGGLDNANTAKLYLSGQELKRFDDHHAAMYRHQHVGFIFQDYSLIHSMNVYENIGLPLKLMGLKVDHKFLDDCLSQVGLEGLGMRRLHELSGGQKQRVAIARALIKNPSLLLADEPTGNLDSETSIQIFELLRTLSKKRCVIVVSHDTEFAQEYADRIIELKDGCVVSDVGQQAEDHPIDVKPLRKAKLPLKMVIQLGFGNLVHNKLRMLVTSLMVAFLVAILASVYTALYAQVNINAKLIEATQLSQLLITEPINIQSRKAYDPTIESTPVRLDTSLLNQVEKIARAQHVDVFPRTQLAVNEAYLTVNDIRWLKRKVVDSYLWLIRPNEVLTQNLLNSYLSFTAYTQIDWTQQKWIGRVPHNENEIILSSYLADMMITQGIEGEANTAQVYETLLAQQSTINITGLEPLKVVGIKLETSPLLRNETSILNSGFGLISTHPSFFLHFNGQQNTQSYGIALTDDTNIERLLMDLRSLGTFSIFPRIDEEINVYTRFSLTFLMALVVPLLGYIALIFLGHSFAFSIAYRRKTIGILRALGLDIQQIQRIFWIEAWVLGIMILGLVILMVPAMIDVLNFSLKLQFIDSFISYTNMDLFSFGLSHIIEVFLILMTILIILVFTLTYHINLLDPVDVIKGK